MSKLFSKPLLCSVGIVLIWNTSFAQTYLVKNVNVIPMDKRDIVIGQNVLIKDGLIQSIGKNIKNSNAIEIDASGKYIMPGLMDMHAHFYYEQGDHLNTCEQELKLMLINGLTTARIQGGHPEYLQAKNNVADGKWVGPRLLVSSLPIAGEGTPGNPFEQICATPEQAITAVRGAKRDGYDAIKLTFMVRPDVYDAVIRTAGEVDIKVTGHVGPLVKLPTALRAGQQIEHMDEFIDMLLPDTSYNHGQSVSDMNLWRKKAWATVPHLDESKIPALVRQVKEAGVYVTPTNFFFYSFFGKGIDEGATKQAKDFQYVPASIKDYAWKVREKYWSNPPPEASREKYLSIRNGLIKGLWKAGVPLMAGSDSPQWFTVTGFAIHDELANLVQAGLTPFAALETATIHPSTYLGLNAGRVSIGKDADLILLDNNPLDDINNTRSIIGVFAKGVWFDSKKLKTLADEAMVLAK